MNPILPKSKVGRDNIHVLVVEDGTKWCPRCQQEKPLKMFGSRSDRIGQPRSRCRKCVSQETNVYQKNNPEKRKAWSAQEALRRKMECMSFYSNGQPKCNCCGELEIHFLALDHVEDDGGERRKAGEPTGGGLYRLLKREGYPEGFQVLCHNCNMAKGLYGQCPHKICHA